MVISKYSLVGIILGTLVAAATSVLGFLYSFSQSTTYEAQARIWVQPKLAEMVPSSYQTSLYAPLTSFFNSPIATAGEVLKSDIVMETAMDIIREELPKSQWPSLGEVKGGISVSAVNNTDILIISFRHADPKVCKVALDAVLDAFLKVNSQQSAKSARQSRIFLERQLRQVQVDCLKARQNVEKFQQENKSIDLSEQVATQLHQLADLELGERNTQMAINQLESKIHYLESKLKIKSEDVVASQKLALDDQVRALQLKLADEEVRYVDYKSKLRETHPRMVQLRLSIEQLHDALKNRIFELVGANDANVESLLSAKDPVQQRLLGDLVSAKADEISEQSRLSTYESQAQEANAKMASIPDKQRILAELKRQEDIATQVLSDTERNLHSTRLLEKVASDASNVQILDRPEGAGALPRTSPGLAVSYGLAAVLGGGTFFVIYLLNPAVRSVATTLNLIPLPIIGWIREVPAGSKPQEIIPGIEGLRINLKSWLNQKTNCFLVTSADPEDGKTVLAAGLALSFAQSGLRVLLVDVNFVHPCLHELFQLSISPGIADYLMAPSSHFLPRLLHQVRPNLDVITAGTLTAPFQKLDSPAFQQLIDLVSPHTDVLILDASSVVDSVEALVLLNEKVNLLIPVSIGNTYKDSLKLFAGQIKYQTFARAGLVFFGCSERSVIAALTTQNAVAEETAPQAAAESETW